MCCQSPVFPRNNSGAMNHTTPSTFDQPAAAVSARRGQLAVGLLQAVPLPAIVLSANDLILFANIAAEELFLRSRRVLEHTHLEGLIGSKSPLKEVVLRARDKGQSIIATDLDFATPNLPVPHCDVVASLLEDGVQVAVMLRPIPNGRESLSQSQVGVGLRSMAAIGRTLAHEIKNPLAGIRGAAQLLMRDLPQDQSQLADVIIQESDRVRRLIDQMEGFGVDVPPVVTTFNVHSILEKVAVMAQSGFASGLMVHRHFDPSLPEIAGDPDQLTQVFLNLAKNAAEAAMHRGEMGEVILSSSYRHGIRRRFGTKEIDLPIEVSFKDNGPGLPPELIDNIFDPFITTKTSGSGLGLPLVQKIVDAHGGLIDFESRNGGTTFRVRLPIQSPADANAPTGPISGSKEATP